MAVSRVQKRSYHPQRVPLYLNGLHWNEGVMHM